MNSTALCLRSMTTRGTRKSPVLRRRVWTEKRRRKMRSWRQQCLPSLPLLMLPRYACWLFDSGSLQCRGEPGLRVSWLDSSGIVDKRGCMGECWTWRHEDMFCAYFSTIFRFLKLGKGCARMLECMLCHP